MSVVGSSSAGGIRPGAARLRGALAAMGLAALVAGCGSDDGMTGGPTNTSAEDQSSRPGTATSTSTAPGSMGTGAGTGGAGGWGEAGGSGGVGGSGGAGVSGGTVGTGG